MRDLGVCQLGGLRELEAARGAEKFDSVVDWQAPKFDFHENLPFGVRMDLAFDALVGTERCRVLAILGREAAGVAGLAVESDTAQGIG